ncbi:hypothetical protein A2961_04115 [Candidatus Woesebacteria bacterium RIFCSPLOWO2_01_FULL_39_21]|uniref:Uncharacterized protein n=1 Tax=Candidatus Woesebacteria bacterium RIFCSPLOWO2_01_FULL_39_21 TaxID=1802519 RepID=A0A1F8BBR8_9BACT|nr:MAG: hypothetical protein A2961_04115 [Candidatus Woesebacteria bacterium RIFCSPLOWO2_01_FULL_39_21]
MKINSYKLLVTVLVAWAVLSSVLLLNLWKRNQKLERITALLVKSLIVSQQLANNASNAYTTFGDCVTNPNTCNAQDTQLKLRKLNEDKEKINLQILKIQDELGELK